MSHTIIAPWRGLRRLTVVLAMTSLAACSLPEPDGTEAALIEQASGKPALQDIPGRSPQAVARKGLLLSPEVRTAASSVSATADQVRIERAALFPSLGLSVRGGRGAASDGDATIELQGRQLLLDFGKTERAVTSADLDLQLNYIAYQEAVDTALFVTLEAYNDVLENVDLLNVRRQQLAAFRRLHDLVAEQTRVGAVASSDLLEARKSLQSAQFFVQDTELALAEARDRMIILTGQPRGGHVPSLPVGACVSPDDADDTRRAQLELARAELNLEDAERAREPRIFIEPVARQRIGEGGISTGVNVGVNSDLLQGGALSARVNAAQNQRDSADAGIGAARRTEQIDKNRLKREIAAAGQRRVMLDRQIALLRQTRRLYRDQYFDLGTRKISDLLDNEEEFYDRQAERIAVRSGLVANQLECAIREDKLRRKLGLTSSTLYGYALDPLLQ